MNMIMTTLQLIVAETMVLPAEHHGHRATAGVLCGRGRSLGRGAHRPGDFSAPGTGTHYQNAVGKRLIERRHHVGAIKHI